MSIDLAASSRATAARAISKVIFSGSRMDYALHEGLANISRHDRALVSEMVNGVTRWYWRLTDYSMQLLDKPFRTKDRDLLCLLLLGLYQLEFMRIPEYACVSSTVAATSRLKKSWAANVINATLRKFTRDREKFVAHACSNAAHFSHPEWMVDLIHHEWPHDWRTILEANNARPTTVLRVNRNKCTVSKYLGLLAKQGIDAVADPVSSSGIRLMNRTDIGDLPGFDQGFVSVQDSAAQLAVPILKVNAGHRVLDACAAPGGKTLQILEEQPNTVEVLALDIDSDRCKKIVENLSRAGQTATVVCGDATKPHSWWDGNQFDRVLVDAPCSGLGVIRRHPEIKHHRRLKDLDQMVNRQEQMMKQLWPTVKPGGMLVYATCTINARENQKVIDRFQNSVDDCVVHQLPSQYGQQLSLGVQRLQGKHDSDGFFYACLSRTEGERSRNS